jgi:hypothetical protein
MSNKSDEMPNHNWPQPSSDEVTTGVGTIGEPRQLTFGEKAVGITFNPGGSPFVNNIKQHYAAIIDILNKERTAAEGGEVKRYFSKAISYSEDAQMNAVKAATWQY